MGDDSFCRREDATVARYLPPPAINLAQADLRDLRAGFRLTEQSPASALRSNDAAVPVTTRDEGPVWVDLSRPIVVRRTAGIGPFETLAVPRENAC